MNARLIIMQTSREGQDPKIFRAYLPANPGGIRKSVGVSASTTGNVQWAIVSCAAKAFKKLNGGELEEIETRIEVSVHPLPSTWFANLTSKDSKCPAIACAAP